jgi:hypothetical protein
MANATNPLMGRSVGHDWADFMATSGHFCWPSMGSSQWPLTSWPADEQCQLFPGVPEPSFAWLTANQIATMIGGMVRVPTAVMLDPTRR